MPSSASNSPNSRSRFGGLLGSLTTAATVGGLTTVSVAPSSADAQTTVLYVDDDAAPGGDGSSWGLAFRDLQDALDIVNQQFRGEWELRIAQGTYVPPTEVWSYRAFRLKPLNVLSAPTLGLGLGHESAALPRWPTVAPTERERLSVSSGVTVKLVGGFAGVGTPKPDIRDPLAFVSIVSGDVLGNDDGSAASHQDNAPMLLQAEMPHATALEIDGMTFEGAASNDGSAWGIYLTRENHLHRVTHSMRDSRFRGIYSEIGGAGVATAASTLDVSSCVFEDMVLGSQSPYETATAGLLYGGQTSGADSRRIKVTDSVFRRLKGMNGAGFGSSSYSSVDAEVLRCRFEDNEAINGAAVRSTGALRLTLRDSQFFRNSARSRGGAVYAGALVESAGCQFIGNTAGDSGGAVFGWVTATECHFEENSALVGGAVFETSFYAERFNSCAFVRNRARAEGGAFYSDRDVLAEDCLFDANRVESQPGTPPTDAVGGAVSARKATLRRCKFFGNAAVSASAHATGGAVFTDDRVTITNSLFSGNIAQGVLSASGGGVTAGTGGELRFVTFSRNRAVGTSGAAFGGGLANGQGPCIVTSSIFWNNDVGLAPHSSSPGADIASFIPFQPVQLRFTVRTGLATTFDANANTGADPRLGDTDGPDNIVGTPDDDVGITTGTSPCVDAAEPGVALECCDVDGRPRQLATPVTSPPSGHPVQADRGAIEFRGDLRCARFVASFDGVVDVGELASFLAAFGRTVAPGDGSDYDGNGVVNVVDLKQLLGAFGCRRWG
ncbi:MAG: hypothetical protein ACKVZJ_11330 [Phycisphaerales bacterium]